MAEGSHDHARTLRLPALSGIYALGGCRDRRGAACRRCRTRHRPSMHEALKSDRRQGFRRLSAEQGRPDRVGVDAAQRAVRCRSIDLAQILFEDRGLAVAEHGIAHDGPAGPEDGIGPVMTSRTGTSASGGPYGNGPTGSVWIGCVVTCPRWHLHVNPPSCVPAQLMEDRFARPTRRRLRRGLFEQTDELKAAIRGDSARTDADPSRLARKRPAIAILANVGCFRCFRRRTADPDHRGIFNARQLFSKP